MTGRENSAAAAADRFFRLYAKHCREPDDDSLLSLLESLHGLNDKLKLAEGVDLFASGAFTALRAMRNLFHHEAEPAVARAAQSAGLLYTLSTMGTTRIEDIAAQGPGPWMFQIYVLKDRALTREFVQRCKAAGYHALCLTVDTALAGNRERDRVTGMIMPPPNMSTLDEPVK